jgi:hypothetical protein
VAAVLVGYNTNVPYKGTIYHVQTEDNGLKNPVIVTLLYLKGTILASKKINYGQIASTPDFKEKVRELMKEQHKTMIKELIAGKHTEATGSSPKPVEEALAQEQPENNASPSNESNDTGPKSLDDILLDYISKKNE